jgi:hypothetical protein
MAITLFFTRRFSEAVVKLLEAPERSPNYVMQYRFLAAFYAHMGRPAEAPETVERLRPITPVVVDSAIRYRNPEYSELYLSGLRLATNARGIGAALEFAGAPSAATLNHKMLIAGQLGFKIAHGGVDVETLPWRVNPEDGK